MKRWVGTIKTEILMPVIHTLVLEYSVDVSFVFLFTGFCFGNQIAAFEQGNDKDGKG
jgi:hypothetical protein